MPAIAEIHQDRPRSSKSMMPALRGVYNAYLKMVEKYIRLVVGGKDRETC